MKQFPHIDILRAVAALLVVVYHVSVLGELDLPIDNAWAVPFRYGWIGVDLFLVISGFVITLSAAKAYDISPHGFKLDFMRRRLYRLVPLYWMTCLIFLFLVRPEVLLRPAGELCAVLISHLLFFQNISHHTHGVINGVSWSLALEMQFYVVLVLFMGQLKRLGALRVFVTLTLLAWCWRYGTTLILKPGEAIAHLQVVYSTQLPGTLDAFGVGIAIALMLHQGQIKVLFRPGAIVSLAWFGAMATLLWLAWFLVRTNASYWTVQGMVVFWRTLLALGFGAGLMAVITLPLPSGGVMRLIHFVGEISYGIYLWHFLTLLALLQLTTLRGVSLLWVLLVGTVCLASMSWHFMEKPWIRKSVISK